MKHRVVLQSRAQTNIRQILDWISRRSPEGANRWLDELDAALLALEDDPERCPLANESESHSREVRELSFHTRRGARYRLVFTIVLDEVRLLSVRAPGQNDIAHEDLN